MSLESGAEASVVSIEVASGRRKLLVLDVNGLLIDRYRRGERCPDRLHDGTVNRFLVYNRPFCSDFVRFCLDHFVVGVWSSAQKNNVHAVVDYIFKEAKKKLAFIWDQGHCTDTGFRHPDNHHKPVFLKELWKLWRKMEPGLPWEAGDYGPSNTLLIDDSAYKAIKNPPHTAIFPKTYTAAADCEDTFLGKELRTFLQGLLQATDVQEYIEKNPIGEPSISMGDRRWSKIFLALKPQTGPSRLVATHVVRTEQSPVPDIPSSRLAEEGSRGLIRRHGLGKEEEKVEQSLRGDDGSDIASLLLKLQLEKVPA